MVVAKNPKARVEFKDYKRKHLCTYNNINGSMNADGLEKFSDAINTLRADEIEYTFLIVESELADEA